MAAPALPLIQEDDAQYRQYVCRCGLTMIDGRRWGFSSSSEKLNRHQFATKHRGWLVVWIKKGS